jgi:hypothetical protein
MRETLDLKINAFKKMERGDMDMAAEPLYRKFREYVGICAIYSYITKNI